VVTVVGIMECIDLGSLVEVLVMGMWIDMVLVMSGGISMKVLVMIITMAMHHPYMQRNLGDLGMVV